eukprot:Nk52_evm41s621 gene=Nk52_evmTU41s621
MTDSSAKREMNNRTHPEKVEDAMVESQASKSFSGANDIAIEMPAKASLFEGAGALLAWKDVTYSVTVKGGEKKTLLSNVSGLVQPGEMLAVMGPSGAGKSTMLDSLAARINLDNIEGSITLNGRDIDSKLKHILSYVAQDDALIGSLTVREAIEYSAKLKSPPSVSAAERKANVDSIIEILGLQRVADSRIGNAVFRGISGGERRRVSVAVEIVTKPKLIFLDEPTSGLDSAASYHVVQGLKDFAKKMGCTIIATIHQPSSSTFELFDKLMLLAYGRTVYFGDREKATSYFAAKGYTCPEFENPAEYFVNIMNADFSNDKDKTMKVISDLQDSFDASEEKVALAKMVECAQGRGTGCSELVQSCLALGTNETPSTYANNLAKQTYILSSRAFVNAYRNVLMFWIRVAMYIMMAILMGTVWFKIGTNQDALQDRFSAHFFAIAFLCFMSVAAIPAFIEDKLVFERERANGAYSTLAYVVSNTIVSLPFVFITALAFSAIAYPLMDLHSGADHFFTYLAVLFLSLYVAESMVVFISSVIPIFVAALAIAAFANGFFMVVQGFFVKKDNIPNYWIWGNYISYQTYGFQALVKNDFPGLLFKCGQTCSIPSTLNPLYFTGDDVLVQYDYEDVKVWEQIIILVAMVVIYRFLFYLTLVFKNGRRN